MVRHSMPWAQGSSNQNGLFFIAYANDVHVFHHTLRKMAGIYDNNIPDKILNNLSKPITGTYFFVPNMLTLRQLSSK